jgi:hypothetical protein
MRVLILININIRKKIFEKKTNNEFLFLFRIGSGRVTFDNSSSFLHAVSTAFGRFNF